MKPSFIIATALCITSCMSYPIQRHRVTEDNILELIKTYIPEDPVIVEAGAHQGEDTLKMSKIWPDGVIYAFEPLPISFSHLHFHSRHVNNIFPHAMALSDSYCIKQFYVCADDPGSSSLLKPTQLMHEYNFKKEPINVTCTTIDKWAQENNVDHIDFMWLDMEGHELAALKAAPRMLPTLKAIYMEVNCGQFREGMPLYPEVKEWMESQGFVVAWSYVNPFWQGNILFVRP